MTTDLPPPQGKVSRWPPRLDAVLTGSVLLLAFLLASFPVRNSDFWMHLAAGRLIAHGEYTFGHDPFAFTTSGVYWANHSWAFDLILYLLSRAVGGAGLVICKGLLVASLAYLMLRIRNKEGGVQVPILCTILALMALGPRLLLQPACVSFVLLALMLWLLWRGRYTGWRALLIPGLCVLWVNLDGWFFLGPILVVLFWLAGWLWQEEPASRVPGWLVPASVAACLCSPHHLHAFVLPAELSIDAGVIVLRRDPRFSPLFVPPWQTGAGAWPWALLVGLGLFSFVVSQKRFPAWRFPVWLAFALLGVWQARLVPFFAVVAGPITALNLQDTLLCLEPRKERLPVVRRAALLAGCLALVVLAWPGWLTGVQGPNRHVGWGIEPNPSLVRSAETVREWRRTGKLAPNERILATHPDVAHYWAWFCPDEKGIVDHRFTLFGAVAHDYMTVCQAVTMRRHSRTVSFGFFRHIFGTRSAPSSGLDWEGLLASWDIQHAVLYDPDRQRLGAVLSRLADPHDELQLCSVDGQALLVSLTNSPANLFDADRLAFRMDDSEREMLPPAPGRGPDHLPAARSWWSAFRKPAVTTWESDAAAVYLRLFQERVQHQGTSLWARLTAGLVGQISPASPLPTRLAAPAIILSSPDRPSPALLLLAIRAARRALASNPEDGQAWLVLGQAYQTLGAVTGEADLGGPHAPLSRLRHIQAVTALHNALLLQPDLEAAHAVLADLYIRREYLDAALPHRLAQVRPGRQSPRTRATLDDLKRALLEQEADDLEKTVQDRQHQFTVETSLPGASTNPLKQARLALRLGLPLKALAILERSQVVLFGTAGARLELELMLMLGRAADARERLIDDEMRANRSKLGIFDLPMLHLDLPQPRPGWVHFYRLPAYEWLRVWESSAWGDHDRAGELLAGVEQRLAAEEARSNLPRVRIGLVQAIATEMLVLGSPQALLLRVGARGERDRLTDLYCRSLLLPAERADLEAMAGMLALERGLPRLAQRHLRQALGLSPRFVARPLVEAYLRRLP